MCPRDGREGVSPLPQGPKPTTLPSRPPHCHTEPAAPASLRTPRPAARAPAPGGPHPHTLQLPVPRTGRPLSGFPANPALALPGTSALRPESVSEALSGRLPCVQKSSVPLSSPAHPGAQPGSCWSLLPRGSPGPPDASRQDLGPQPPPPRGCPAHSHSRGPGETGSFPASRAGQAQRRGDSAQGTLADSPAQREHIWGWLSDTPTSGPDEAV